MVNFVHLNRTLLRRLYANECSGWSLAESKNLAGVLCFQGTNLNIIHKSVYRWSLLLHNENIELKNVNREYSSWVLGEELLRLGEETLEMFTLIPHLNTIMVNHPSHSLSILSKIVTFAILHLSNKSLYFSKKLARLAAERPLSKRTSELYMIIIILTREPSVKIADQVVQEWSEHLESGQSVSSESDISKQSSFGENENENDNNNNSNNINNSGNIYITGKDIINQANKFTDRLSEEYKTIELHKEDLNIVSNLLSIIFERMSDKKQVEKDDSAFYFNLNSKEVIEESLNLRIKSMIWSSSLHNVTTIERIHLIHLLTDLLYVLKISSLKSTNYFTKKVREDIIDLVNNFVLFKTLPSVLQHRYLTFRELELIYRVASSTVLEWSGVGLQMLRRILHVSWCKGTNPLSHLALDDKLRMYVVIIVHMQRYSGLMEQQRLTELLLTSWPLFFDVVPSSVGRYKNSTKNKEHELFSSEWVCWQDLPELKLSSDIQKTDITRLFFLVWIISNTMCLRREFKFEISSEVYLSMEKMLNACVHILFNKAKEYEPYELDLSYVKKRQIRKAIHLFQANAAYMRFARMRCITRFEDSLAHFKNEQEAEVFCLNALEACKQYYKSMLSTNQRHAKTNSSTPLCSVEAKLAEPSTSSERPTIVVPSVIDIIKEIPDKEVEDILNKPSNNKSKITMAGTGAASLEHNANSKSNAASGDNDYEKRNINEEVNVEVNSIPTSRFSGFTADVMQMSDFVIGLLTHPYTANNRKLLKEVVKVYELYVEQLIMETNGRLSSIKVTLLTNALNFCMNDWEKFMQHLAYSEGEETYYRLRDKLKELAVVNLECFIEPNPMWMTSFDFVNQKNFNSTTNQNFMSKVPFLSTSKGKKVVYEVTFLLGRYIRALSMLSTLGISIDTLNDANVIEHNLISALKYVNTIESMEERNLVELIRFCTIVCDTGYLKENLLKAMLTALRKLTNEAVIRNINDFFRARVLRDLWIMFNVLQPTFATMHVHRALGRYIVAFITRLSLERVAYTGPHWQIRARRYGHIEEFSSSYENIRNDKLLKVICAQRMLLFTFSLSTTMLRGVPLENYLNSMLAFVRRHMKTNLTNGANNQTLKVLKQENGYIGDRTFRAFFNEKRVEYVPGTDRNDLEYILEANFIFLKVVLVIVKPLEEYLQSTEDDRSIYVKRMHAIISTLSTLFLANEFIIMPSTWYSFCRIACYFERLFGREGYFDELLHQTRIVALTHVLLYVKSRNNCGSWAGYRSLSERIKDNCLIWPQNETSNKMPESEERSTTINLKTKSSNNRNKDKDKEKGNVAKDNYGNECDDEDDDDDDDESNSDLSTRHEHLSIASVSQEQSSRENKITDDNNYNRGKADTGSGESKMKSNGAKNDGVRSLHENNIIVRGRKVEQSRETNYNVNEDYRRYKKEMTKEPSHREKEYYEEEEESEKLPYLEEQTYEEMLLSRRVLSEYFTMQTSGLDTDVRQYLIELVAQQFDLMPSFFPSTPENLESSFNDWVDDRDERKRFAESCFVNSVEKDDKTGETHVVKKCKFKYLRASLTPNTNEEQCQALRFDGIDTFVISRALASLHS